MSFLNRLSNALPRHFWPIWILGLLGVLLVPLWMFLTHPVSGSQNAPEEPRTAKVQVPSRLAATCFGVFLTLYIAFMLWAEDFAFQDGHAFTDYSAIGIARPPSIWLDSGRFWPLGYDEYNLIAHLSPTAPAYLAFNSVLLLVGLYLLYLAMPRQNPTLRLCTFAALLLAPAFGVDFSELTYADHNVAFAICVLVFVVDRYDRRPSLSWLLAAIVAGYSALYYKETTTALFGGFAITRVLLSASRNGWHRALRSPLEIGMLLSCACFAAQLGLVLLPSGTSMYVNEGTVGRLTATFRYLRADPLLTAFLVAFGFHIVLTLRRGAKFDPLWDSLAVGAVLHFAAVCSTGLESDYLLGPTELVAGLTLLRLVPQWWQERPSVRPVLACVGAATLAVSSTFCTYRLIERKNVVCQTQRIADFVVNYYRAPGAKKTRLYLLSDDGTVMNFVSFLRYRGLRFYMHGEPGGADAIDVAGSEAFAQDRCVHYEDYVCRHDVTRPGDLVIRLAEDTWSTVIPASGTSLEPLFQASPADFFPSLRPLLSALYRVSPTMRGAFHPEPVPDDWLRVSATRVVTSVAAPNAQPKD